MSRPIIEVVDLCKSYRLGMIGASTMRDALSNWWRGPRPQDGKEFHALREVSFSVQPGEVVAIVGRNGAGKSTLLKILSRITEPTSGRATLRGRVASLLEVGTGFHPDLTGRENIFLNGALLGMTRPEIRRKFDEIVAFSEVERFIDTPVKRYSSGMYVRLAFAVAAHLEPEILIVDEVLAVGDAAFQAKCLGKIRQVAGTDGRTVLFVSHNMLAVQSLCDRAILLRDGSVAASGSVKDVLIEYFAAAAPDSYAGTADTALPRILAARVVSAPLLTNLPLEIVIEWEVPVNSPPVKIGVGVNTPENQRIFDCVPSDTGVAFAHTPGRHQARLRIPRHTLMARTYHVSVGLWWNTTVYDHANPAFAVTLEASPGGPYMEEKSREGLVHVPAEWEFLQ